MYWSMNGVKTKVPTIPYYEIGSDFDFAASLCAESGDDIAEAYLFVSSEFEGILKAKRHADPDYLDIMGVGNANCNIGAITAGNIIDIDFRISTSDASKAGYKIIQVFVESTEYSL